jgi:CubicO group peptidase (beta-lactamase class C family)
VLLSFIIEKVSGMRWQDYFAQRLLAPAGMTQTSAFAPDMGGALVPGANGPGPPASPYEPQWTAGAGGLQSTAGDLEKWSNALYGGGVISCSSVAEMVAPRAPEPSASSTAADQDIAYGFGMESAVHNGLPYLFHGGLIPGYTAETIYVPSGALAIAVIENSWDPAMLACVVPRLLDAAAQDLSARSPATDGSPGGR